MQAENKEMRETVLVKAKEVTGPAPSEERDLQLYRKKMDDLKSKTQKKSENL